MKYIDDAFFCERETLEAGDHGKILAIIINHAYNILIHLWLI